MGFRRNTVVLPAARSTWSRAQAQTSSGATPSFMPKMPCSTLKIPSKPRPASQTSAAIASGLPWADLSLRIACSFMRHFEQESNRGQIGSDIDPSLASAINNFLATGAFPRLNIRQITTGFSPIARAETEASGKLNYQINSRNSLMLRYAFTNNRVAGNAFNTTALQDASARGSSFTSDNDGGRFPGHSLRFRGCWRLAFPGGNTPCSLTHERCGRPRNRYRRPGGFWAAVCWQ